MYLCLECLQYAPCKCCSKLITKPTETWTRKKVYDIQITEVINYSGEKDDDGELESEDRGDCDFYSLKDWRYAKAVISEFEPYELENGNGHVFKLEIDVGVFYHHFCNGEFHHDEKIDDIEPKDAPKKVRSIIDKIR